MQKVLAYITEKPFGDTNRVTLTCSLNNQAALRLNQSFGILPTGHSVEDELKLYLDLID